jgi:hypothetical protein
LRQAAIRPRGRCCWFERVVELGPAPACAARPPARVEDSATPLIAAAAPHGQSRRCGPQPAPLDDVVACVPEDRVVVAQDSKGIRCRPVVRVGDRRRRGGNRRSGIGMKEVLRAVTPLLARAGVVLGRGPVAVAAVGGDRAVNASLAVAPPSGQTSTSPGGCRSRKDDVVKFAGRWRSPPSHSLVGKITILAWG